MSPSGEADGAVQIGAIVRFSFNKPSDWIRSTNGRGLMPNVTRLMSDCSYHTMRVSCDTVVIRSFNYAVFVKRRTTRL